MQTRYRYCLIDRLLSYCSLTNRQDLSRSHLKGRARPELWKGSLISSFATFWGWTWILHQIHREGLTWKHQVWRMELCSRSDFQRSWQIVNIMWNFLHWNYPKSSLYLRTIPLELRNHCGALMVCALSSISSWTLALWTLSWRVKHRSQCWIR